MTQYDPRHWTNHLLDIEGSMVREILGRVVASILWSTLVVLLFFYGPTFCQRMPIPPTAHTFVGTVLGLLLVFRTNSSYDRFWEGRKQWGGIVNECRNFARQSSVWLASDPEVMREVISWAIAFPFATMQRLRHESGFGVVLSGVADTDIKRIEASPHIPLAVTRRISTQLLSARQRGVIDGLQLASLDQNLQLLIGYCGACERIRSTPMPFAYVVHLRRILIIYCMTLPFALVKDFGWTTIPTTLLITYGLFGIEEIGVEIEDPFGYTTNDLPLPTICAGVETVLRDIRDESNPV